MRQLVVRVVTLALMIGGSALVNAAPQLTTVTPLQTHKLLANDGAPDDRFGFAVAVSGNLALIGATGDENGDYSGSAYVFDVTTGQELMKLTPDDTGSGRRYFGNAVGLAGTRAIVGAHYEINGLQSGSAYLFDVSTGAQLAKLIAPDGEVGRRFGSSVALSENRALVGATWYNSGGVTSGKAFVFDATTGQQLATLAPDDPTPRKEFGESVAIAGNLAIVGARGDSEYESWCGAAYVLDATTGEQLAKLTPDDPTETKEFGTSVSLDGRLALIGAPGDDEEYENVGSAYLFDVITGQQLAKFTADDGQWRDDFGWSVALSGDTAIIGARLEDANGVDSGAAYVFNVTTGEQIMRLTPIENPAGDWFAYSVALDGSRAVVGALFDDNSNGLDSGSAYVYEGVPEPSTLILLAMGAVGVLVWAWRRRRRA